MIQRMTAISAAVLACASGVAMGQPYQTCELATSGASVGAGLHGFSTLNPVTDHNTPECISTQWGLAVPTDGLWFKYTVGNTRVATVSIADCQHLLLDPGITIYSTCGQVLYCKASACNSPIHMFVNAGETYLIRVGTAGALPEYELPSSAGAATLAIAEYAIPENDLCGGATLVGEGLHAVNTAGGGLDMTPQGTWCPSTNDIFYRFIAPAEALYEFNAVGSNDTPFNISLHTGCNQAPIGGSCSAINGVTGGSRISKLMTTGEEVILRVGAPYGGNPNWTGYLGISSDIQPSYDSCNNALAVGLGMTTFDTTGCFIDEPSECGGVNDAFFSFTPTQTAEYTIDTCGSLFDTSLSLSSVCGGAESGCNRDTHGEECKRVRFPSRLSVELQAHQPVYIRVAGQGVEQRGYGQLQITLDRVICAADFNGDNTRDVADLFAYINAWLAKTAAADFNGDTTVDVADLFAYINAWLAGC